jgi:hypothetical protein
MDPRRALDLPVRSRLRGGEPFTGAISLSRCSNGARLMRHWGQVGRYVYGSKTGAIRGRLWVKRSGFRRGLFDSDFLLLNF